jgi:hypothetical protein
VTGGQPNEDKNDRDTAGQREQDKDQAAEAGEARRTYRSSRCPRGRDTGQSVKRLQVVISVRVAGVESNLSTSRRFGQNGRSGQPNPNTGAHCS